VTRRRAPDWRQIDAVAGEIAVDVADMGHTELIGTLFAGLRVLADRMGHRQATTLALGLAMRAKTGSPSQLERKTRDERPE